MEFDPTAYDVTVARTFGPPRESIWWAFVDPVD